MPQDIGIPLLNSYSVMFHRDFVITVSFKNITKLHILQTTSIQIKMFWTTA